MWGQTPAQNALFEGNSQMSPKTDMSRGDRPRNVLGDSPQKRQARETKIGKTKTAAKATVLSPTLGGQGRDRTGDTRIFSPLLYQLSYLATGWGENGRSAGIRTLDPVIKSHLLYQLSYAPIPPFRLSGAS